MHRGPRPQPGSWLLVRDPGVLKTRIHSRPFHWWWPQDTDAHDNYIPPSTVWGQSCEQMSKPGRVASLPRMSVLRNECQQANGVTWEPLPRWPFRGRSRLSSLCGQHKKEVRADLHLCLAPRIHRSAVEAKCRSQPGALRTPRAEGSRRQGLGRWEVLGCLPRRRGDRPDGQG